MRDAAALISSEKRTRDSTENHTQTYVRYNNDLLSRSWLKATVARTDNNNIVSSPLGYKIDPPPYAPTSHRLRDESTIRTTDRTI